ncbi:Mesoderm induction early response protein 1 [Halotydeus destructor]|nr:Mesoderm induction early response protein 1 [Halotydeus destructor]
MAEPTASESSAGNESDQDFDPSADMLVNDFDDEHTLDEEEAIDEVDNEEEIDDLQKEGEMPIEELMKLYGYGAQPTQSDTVQPTASGESVLVSETSSSNSQDNAALHPSQSTELSASTNDTNPDTSAPGTVWQLATSSLLGVEEEESDGEDEDYEETGCEDWRRTIQVGSEYQAQIVDGLSKYDGVPAYENEDTLLWDPSGLEEKDIVDYLGNIQHLKEVDDSVALDAVSEQAPLIRLPDPALPTGCHIRDDQQALYLLHQCGHKADEALRRMQSQKNDVFSCMTSWSEEECQNFEEGLRVYGKDFHLIQKNKVKTRSVSELVQFYYYWKKTERHDIFASKFRIEKKKYSLHPGTTDYMDRFLDEQENLALHGSTCPPNSQSRTNNNASNSIMYPANHPTNSQRVSEQAVADSGSNMMLTNGKTEHLGVPTTSENFPQKTLSPTSVSEGLPIITESCITSSAVVAPSESCK